jgi:hypothetical protein
MKLYALVATMLVLVFAENNPAKSEMQISGGFGYDYISSDYYLLTADTLSITPDSVEQLKRTSEAVNEMILIGRVRYEHRFSDQFKLDVYNRTTYSEQALRNYLDFGIHYGSFRLENYFSFKQNNSPEIDNEESFSQDYITNQTSARFRPHLGSGFYLGVKNSYEFTRYDNPGGYYYDFSYNKLDFTFEKEFGLDGRISFGYRNDLKKVTDSTRLEYDRNIVMLYAEYSPSYNLRMELDNRYSSKNSKKEGSLDDEKLEDLQIVLDYQPSALISLRFYNQFEYITYDSQDIVYYDQIYLRSEFEAEFTLTNELEFSLTPHYRTLSAVEDEFSDQDYVEYSLEPGFSYMAMSGNLWVDFSFEFGRRDYSQDDVDFFSDHVLYQLNLLFDLNLFDRLNLYLLGAVDWQRHENKQDNSTLYLLSSAIEYSF